MDTDSGLVCTSEEVINVSRIVTSPDHKAESARTGLVGSVLLYSLIVCIGGVIGGFSHGFPSPTLLDLQKDYDGGQRVTAFPSSSVYAGLFGVSAHVHPAPPTTCMITSSSHIS